MRSQSGRHRCKGYCSFYLCPFHQDFFYRDFDLILYRFVNQNFLYILSAMVEFYCKIRQVKHWTFFLGVLLAFWCICPLVSFIIICLQIAPLYLCCGGIYLQWTTSVQKFRFSILSRDSFLGQFSI